MTSSVENLAELWASLDELLSSLDDAAWSLPTGNPGWTVQDNVSHLVDYESRALGDPPPEHTAPDVAHVKNEIGRHNEVGVDVRRTHSPAEIRAEFRDVTARRLAQLRALSDADLERATTTPVGPGTVQSMLTLRVMDTWGHEQDIRRAVGRPGHVDGAAVDEAIAYFSTLMPYVVGKRAAAPEGSTAVFRIGERAPLAIAVSGGRARPAEDTPTEPTVELAFPVGTFCALVCGRSDAPADYRITGDTELGARIVAGMGVMP